MYKTIVTSLLLIFISHKSILENEEKKPDIFKKKPNIILYLVDDLGYKGVGYTGNTIVETPRIDEYSKKSVILSNAYTASPECSPTRASVLTGKHPARLHITRWISHNKKQSNMVYKNHTLPAEEHEIGLDEYTIAEALKDNGYKTCHIGKWHIGGEDFRPTKHGFDKDIAYTRGAGLGLSKWFFPHYIKTLKGGNPGDYLSDRLGDEAVNFIKTNKDKPFFLNFWHYAVHSPIVGKKSLVKKYLEKGAPENHKAYQNAKYQAMTESVDDNFGKLIDALKEEGILDNTIIIFYSDNGGVNGIANNKPYRGGKKMLFEGGNRVPGYIYWSKLKPKSIEYPVTTIDFYPTLLDMACIKNKTQKFDGVSVLPALKGKKMTERSLYWHQLTNKHGGPKSSIIKGNYKFLEHRVDGKTMLFDLSTDKGEKRNLIKKKPKLVKSLKKELYEYLKGVGAQFEVQKT